jgi:hypothetical protein
MTPQFLTALETEYLGYSNNRYMPWKRPWWRLTAPLEYWTGHIVITVPKGFCTDFSSVPRVPVVWWIFGGTACRAGVTHDYMYRQGFDRRYADDTFRQAILATGYNQAHAAAMWAAVRAFGWLAYDPRPGLLDPRTS